MNQHVCQSVVKGKTAVWETPFLTVKTTGETPVPQCATGCYDTFTARVRFRGLLALDGELHKLYNRKPLEQ